MMCTHETKMVVNRKCRQIYAACPEILVLIINKTAWFMTKKGMYIQFYILNLYFR